MNRILPAGPVNFSSLTKELQDSPSYSLSLLTLKRLEHPLNWSYNFSLKDVSLRRVAVSLFNDNAFLCFVGNISVSPPEPPEQAEVAIQSKGKSILSKLPLPESLKEEILLLLKPLCREIALWIDFHEKYFKKYVNMHCLVILKHLRWTPVWTIDYQKTAEELIRHEMLEIHERYKLACLYCVLDSIRDLWRKIPERTKTCFYDERSPLRVKKPRIVILWTYFLKGQTAKLVDFIEPNARRNTSICQWIFETSAVEGHKTATEYFFKNLTAPQKAISLLRTAEAVIDKLSTGLQDGTYRQEHQKFNEVLFYLFSVMTHLKRIRVIKKYPCEILKCCLDWPRQDIFVDVAKLVFPFLNQEDYTFLLFIISTNITWGYNCSNVYQKFFLASPGKFRNYSLEQNGLFLRELFSIEDVEAVKIIFRNLDAAAKVKLVFSKSSFQSCCDLIRKDNWNLLELFVREAMLSETDRHKFTMTFVARYPSSMAKDSCQTFVALVNSIYETASKPKATPIDLRPTEDVPDTDLGESPAKKQKKV